MPMPFFFFSKRHQLLAAYINPLVGLVAAVFAAVFTAQKPVSSLGKPSREVCLPSS
jgi:hypothetical protein